MSGVRFTKPYERTDVTEVFYGINKGERIPDGYFSDTLNMTSDKYPCLATRAERAVVSFDGEITAPGEPTAAISYNNGLVLACSNGMLMYGDKVIDGLTVTTSIVPFGNKIYCSPSGILIDKDFSTFKYARLYCQDNFSVSLCDSALNEVDPSVYSDAAPASPKNGQLWYDTGNNGLYRYSQAYSEWVAVPSVYIKISNSDFNFININEGDALSLSFEGCDGSDVEMLDIESFVSSVGADYITIEGTLPDKGYIGAYQVQIERKLPTLSFAVSHNNRIWGCFYDGSLNEIYASKLGNPLSWYCYRGLSSDSYAVSCGEHGNFTGCAELGDTVVFFKENCIYTVYGTEPSNFQTVKTDCCGVQEGSDKSICRINGAVYYKSCHGIMRLSEGSLPVLISQALGPDRWSDAVAGTDGRRYYILMTDLTGEREMYVYDTVTEVWHMEDAGCSDLFCFAEFGNNLLAIGKKETAVQAKEIRIPKITEDLCPKREDFNSDALYVIAVIAFGLALSLYYLNIRGKTDDEIKQFIAERDGKDISEVTDAELEEMLDTCYERHPSYVHKLNFSYVTNELTCNAFLPVVSDMEYRIEDEGRFLWECETGLRGLSLSDYKRLKGIDIKMKLSPGARCDIYIEYDGNGKWENIGSTDEDGIKTLRINDRLSKCEVYRLRLRGYGQAVIYSIIETYEEAGNIGF